MDKQLFIKSIEAIQEQIKYDISVSVELQMFNLAVQPTYSQYPVIFCAFLSRV